MKLLIYVLLLALPTLLIAKMEVHVDYKGKTYRYDAKSSKMKEIRHNKLSCLVANLTFENGTESTILTCDNGNKKDIYQLQALCPKVKDNSIKKYMGVSYLVELCDDVDCTKGKTSYGLKILCK